MSLGIAIIGLGRWGPNHVRNFSSFQDCRVVAAADPDARSRDRIKSIYRDIECVADYREVLSRKDVDAVVVATPTSTHYAIVKDALNSGMHVLCEKPLTSVSGEAWELLNIARRAGRQLMVGHVFLFNAGIEYLVQAVRDHSVGKLFYVNATRTNLGPFRSDVNAAWDLASHDIYIFNTIIGHRPLWVSAVGESYLRKPVEDIVFLTLQYPGDVLGHIHVSWLDPKKVRTITVVGEKKMVTWDEFGTPGPVMIYDRTVVRDPVYNTYGEFQLLTREGDVVVPRIRMQEPLAAQALSFVKTCLEKAGDSGSIGNGKDGAEVVDILAAASSSLRQSGRRVEVHYGG